MHDLVIKSASVLDGTGAPAFEADVAIDGDRLAAVGVVGGAAARELDGSGLTLAPGFIDTHTHDDAALLRYPGLEFKLAQGVTSVVVGNCGFSAAPGAQQALRLFEGIFGGVEVDWDDTAGYLDAVSRRRPAVNSIALIGHSTLRLAAMGTEKRAPTDSELAQMRAWVRQAMEQGACGLSTGLIYTPGRYAETDEIVALAEEIAPHGGVYASHMRNEAFALLDAVNETIGIGEAAGCAVHISHHKSAGKPNWGRVRESLALVDEARERGRDVTLDVYPYTAASSRLEAYVENGIVIDATADDMRIAWCPSLPQYEGWTMRRIAADLGLDVPSAAARLLEGEGRHSVAIFEAMDEADVETNLRHPHMMVGSDGIPVLEGKPHPRLYGTFPRVLARYVRERGVLSLPEAVRRMTSLSCQRFGLRDRGVVQEGAFADLVLFDPARINDTATYEDPMREPVGVAAVIVNGAVAYEDGKHTGAGTGRVLRFAPVSLPA
jgi:N-acyl-D-aspartate/D-glutamate deacylase